MWEVSADLVAAYIQVFVHCFDSYAVQQRNGSYWRVCEPLTLDRIAAHLLGRWTLGTYLLDQYSCCSFAVFDADSPYGLEQLVGLSGELAQQGIPTLLEASRRGGHLWVHFAGSAPARQVRAWLLPYATAYGIELYPKQDWRVPGGPGSLIRLPLGIHQRSRKWYPFVWLTPEGRLVPVGDTVAECCSWACQQVQWVMVPELTVPVCSVAESPEGVKVRGEEGRAPLHQRVESIRAWCRSHDIVAVIGRYMVLDHRGVGSCPFKDHHYRGDRRPSFQVFGGGDPHWYCYTWRRAGDLFTFLCLYHGISPQEGWERLQQGTLLM